MTIFNLLLLVLVLVFSTESMADWSCAVSNPYMLWGECPLSPFSHEGMASRWNPRVKPTPRIAPPKYDELLLVFQWPTSFCKAEMINCPPKNYFTVHGLWLNDNSVPVCCPRSNTRISVSPLINDGLLEFMIQYWPNLKCPGDARRFWVYEYAKHVSCVEEFRYQLTYFETAYYIARLVGSVTEMLLSSGKTLQKGRFYKAEDFEYVTIHSGVRVIPMLRCSKAVGEGTAQLQEIVFCTNKSKQLKNCSNTGKCRMGDHYIPRDEKFKFP